MAVLEIIRMGHPTLRQTAEPFPAEKIGSRDFIRLIDDMRDTMYAAGGIGLAAPQVNVPWQIAVIEIPMTDSRHGDLSGFPFAVYVNPKITLLDEQSDGYWEGCLSVPGMMGYVERPRHIRVDYLDHEGEAQSLEAEGFTATVFQHEFDHLHGKLYVDRITDLRQFVYQEEYQRFHADVDETRNI